MSTPVEIIDIPPEVSGGGEVTLAAWKLGFDAGMKATQQQAQDEVRDFRGFECDRVRFRSALVRRACEWVSTAHECYDGRSNELDDSITAAASYVKLVFEDEADRIRAEWSDDEED
jgi:sigma54-dependent transcription regulator